MPLIKLPFKPGINREIPEYANEGGFDFSNLIRFRMGYAEKLGGWANTNYAAFMQGLTATLQTNTFNGVTRSLHNWVTLDNDNLIGFGTTQQFYIQDEIGTYYRDISPSAYVASLKGSSFRTVEVGSPIIQVVNTPFLGSITAGGTLYTAGTYSNVALTGGSGTGARANITISGGAVTSVTVVNSGSGYVVGNVLSVAAASVGGTGSGFQYTVSGGISGSIVSSSIMTPPPNQGLDVGSVVYFYASTLGGALLLETSPPLPGTQEYLVQETWPGTPTSPNGYKFTIGVQPTLAINGVGINAQNRQNNISATPYVVTSVTRRTIVGASISATGSTVTLTGTISAGNLPIVGVWLTVYGMSVDGYNGSYQVLSCNYNSDTSVIVLTYSCPQGTGSASNGTVTWIDSFSFIGDSNATSVGYSTDATTLNLDISGYYLPNAGDSTVIYNNLGPLTYNKRLWSQASFGDDLIMSIQGNPIYYWVKDTISYEPGTTLAAFANTQNYQQATVVSNSVNTSTFSVEFADYVFPGQTVTLSSGSGTIPTTTKVVDIIGTTVTVDQLVTVYGGGGVVTTTAFAGGSGYLASLTFTNVALAGGSGTGARISYTTNASGNINAGSITFTNVGYNYQIGNVLTFSTTAGSSWFGGGTISNQGQHTPNSTTYTNVPLTGGSGTGARATIHVDASGHVDSVIITDPGTGYLIGDVLSSTSIGTSSTALGYTLTTAGTGFSITVATLTSTSIIDLSYSGQYVPTQTNKIFISSVYQFVIALGANPYNPFEPNSAFNPLLVRWSDQANPSQWIPQADNQSGEQTLGNGSTIVTAVSNLQAILVFTDTAVYQMQYIGPPYVFSFTMLQENISIISQNAAVTANNVTWWMGLDKFYMYNGTVQVLPCPIRRFVFTNLNKEQSWKIVVGYNEGFSEIWWFYPSSTSLINDSYVKFNFVDNVWDYGSLNRTAWNGNAIQDYPIAAYSVQNTYLTAAVTSSSTTIPVADTSSFHDNGILLIGSEQIIYTSKTSTAFTGLTRPSPASHSKYVPVKMLTPNQLIFHEYGLDDNTIPNVTLPVPSFIQTSDVGLQEGNSLFALGRIIPDLTFTNTNTTTCPNPVITMTVYPRLNPGSDYNTSVDSPLITSTYLPTFESQPYPPEQYTGEPNTRALITIGQGQIYTRVRGRTISVRVNTGDVNTSVSVPGYPLQVYANSIGNMWQLGLMRFDVRTDGKR